MGKPRQRPKRPTPRGGVIVIDKPEGLVSMRVVERVRRLTRIKRAGHAGTLDPAATGVLPICLGQATRIASLLLGEDKEYEATVRLGLETNTYDLEGDIQREAEVPAAIDAEELAAHLATLTGKITQRPPAFSAIRVDGERLYERARRGDTVEVPERQVVVHEIELLSSELPEIRLRVRCGKGTYIRSLAFDLGRLLGCGGCLAALRRTRVGTLGLERAVTLEELAELAEAEQVEQSLISASAALAYLPAVTLEASGLTKLGFGQRVGVGDIVEEALPEAEPETFVRLLDAAGVLAALAEVADGELQPRRVFVE